MIEATCAACGTLNRIAEGDVPQGAKFLTCSSCKSRVPIPGKQTMSGVPAIPSIPVSGAPPKSPPPIPSISKPTMDLSDLPAPKRQNPLAGAGEAKPAPKSALGEAARTSTKSAFADLEVDLPAPKSSRAASHLDVADLGPMAPVTMPVAEPAQVEPAEISLGKPGAHADLPAPKARSGLPSIKSVNPLDAKTEMGGAATSPGVSDVDLPAPKAKAPARPATGQMPAVAPPTKSPDLEADLLAPKAGKPAAAKPAPVEAKPAPASPPGKSLPLDLPAPKRASTQAETIPAGPPATPPPATGPKGFFDDLPSPVGKHSNKPDLPAPKGFFDDLPQPSANQPSKPDRQDRQDKPDLPAPKGFFDDLPQPATGGGSRQPDLPAPKGFFDDLPQPATGGGARQPDLPAPKGFFEDLPQPASTGKQPDLPAPKGFFEDLPQPAGAAKQPELPVPKGFFEDLPQAKGPGAQLPNPVGPGPQLPQPLSLEDMELDSGSSHELELQGPSPELDLGLPTPEKAPAGDNFGDLDLQQPSASGGIRFEKPKQTPKPSESPPPTPFTAKKGGAGDINLELADELPGAQQAKAKAKEKEQPRKDGKPKLDQAQQAELAAKRKKRTRIALVALLVVAGGGAGGFMLYQRREAAHARQARIGEQVDKARKALAATDATHWQRAISAAKAALAEDEAQPDALAAGAEASLASALESGINGPVLIRQGHKWLQKANEKSLSSPALTRARALDDIAQNHPDLAITKLQQLVQGNPKDGYLQLYLGWALLQKGDPAAAIKAFDAATSSPGSKTSALYGRGQARLVTGDLPGARTDFAAVLESQKDNIPAMVGLAASTPPTQTQQRESDLLAILARKDISNADPRAVVQAYTLAADVARQSGRLDVARERYRKALAITQLDVAALTGLAATELRDGKIEVANEQIKQALTQSPNDPDGQLVASEINIRQGKLKEAEDRLLALEGRTPPLPPVQEGRMHFIKGKLLEARGQDEQAVDEYVAGGKAAGDLDLAPTMAAVIKLGALAQKDPTKAADYRARADQLLQPLAARAEEDPQLSLALGVAYLETGDPAKAEVFLRRTVEMRATDADAKLQLAKALSKLGRVDESIEQLRGALAIDGTRIDISLELARTFEAAGREADARQAYETLLSANEVPMVARVHAGRFFARIGDLKKAVTQAEPILLADPDNAAGHYLKGEHLLMDGKLDEARRELSLAADTDPDPYYYDAAGRAAEASIQATGDLKFVDLAIHNYDLAHQGMPTLFNPMAGLGRLYVQKKEWTKALESLLEANKLKAGDPEVTYEIGLCYQSLGTLEQRKAAIEWFKQANNLNKGRSAEISWRLGELWSEPDINQPALAAAAYTSATRLAAEEKKQTGKQPEWLIETYYKLGDLQYGLGRLGEARSAFRSYVDLGPPQGRHFEDARYKLAHELQ